MTYHFKFQIPHSKLKKLCSVGDLPETNCIISNWKWYQGQNLPNLRTDE
jgi:hypothetical protein